MTHEGVTSPVDHIRVIKNVPSVEWAENYTLKIRLVIAQSGQFLPRLGKFPASGALKFVLVPNFLIWDREVSEQIDAVSQRFEVSIDNHTITGSYDSRHVLNKD